MTSETLRGGIFNLEYGQTPTTVLKVVTALVEKWDLDFLVVQEAKDYARLLKYIPGYNYYTDFENPGGSQNGILVHKRADPTRPRYKSIGDGWNISRRTRHAPLSFPRVTINGWLRVASIHMPTPLVWKGDKITGPDERIDDYLAQARKIVRFFRQPRPRARIVAGDWNEKPETTGKWSPTWIAKKVGAQIVASREREGHYRIDYPMFKGCRIINLFKDLEIKEWSDHEPIIFTVVRGD